MVYWLLLLGAILTECLGTALCKCGNFWLRYVGGAMGYVVSVWLFAGAVRGLNLAIANTIWCGLGIVLVCLVDQMVFSEAITLRQYIYIAVIAAGVIGLGME